MGNIKYIYLIYKIHIMKKIIFIPILLLFLISCRKQTELPVEKIYLVEYRHGLPEGANIPWQFRVAGITEVGKDFVLNTIRLREDGVYYMDKVVLADSIKERLSAIIKTFPNDTSFYVKNDEFRIYDGGYYFIRIDKGNDSIQFIDLHITREINDDRIKFLYDYLYGNYEERILKTKIFNRDSLENEFKIIEKWLPDSLIPKPFPPYP